MQAPKVRFARLPAAAVLSLAMWSPNPSVAARPVPPTYAMDVDYDPVMRAIDVEVVGVNQRGVIDVIFCDFAGNPIPVPVNRTGGIFHFDLITLAPGHYSLQARTTRATFTARFTLPPM